MMHHHTKFGSKKIKQLKRFCPDEYSLKFWTLLVILTLNTCIYLLSVNFAHHCDPEPCIQYNSSLVLFHIPWTVIGIFSWKSVVMNLLRVGKEDLKYLQEKQCKLIKDLNINNIPPQKTVKIPELSFPYWHWVSFYLIKYQNCTSLNDSHSKDLLQNRPTANRLTSSESYFCIFKRILKNVQCRDHVIKK